MKIRFIRLIRVPFFLLLLSACSPSTPASTSTPTHRAVSVPFVSLTFDDGDADNFTLAPLLRQYNVPATFYIPSGLVGTAGYMTWDELKTLQDSGSEIGGHSLDHVKVSGLDPATLQHEICDDRQNLVAHGFTPVTFAYPFGNYDPAVLAMLKQCGYLGARTIRDGPQSFPLADPYLVKALPYIVSDTDLGKLERYVTGSAKEGAGWVVLIFHHVCDSCDYFAVHPDIMSKFIPWLARQQSMGNLKLATFGQVIAEQAK